MSGLINIRSGLNRFLQNPPNNQTCNLMNDRVFLTANKVLTGKMRTNKQELDTSRPKEAIDTKDLEKLNNEYFLEGLKQGNTEILQQKVFFDILYYTGRCGKEGLRSLKPDSLDLKTTPEGREYFELKYNESTKKNKGDNSSSSAKALHNEPCIILDQPTSNLCPVNSLKEFQKLIHKDLNGLFQRPNATKDGFEKQVLGKNTLGTMMKTISINAGLSKIYTNHCVRYTVSVGMMDGGHSLKDVSNVTKHKNLQSLSTYLGRPTIRNKMSYNDTLYKYATGHEPTAKSQAVKRPNPTSLSTVCKENVDIDANQSRSEKCAKLVAPETSIVPASQGECGPRVSVISNTQNNQMGKLPTFFAGATFSNCTINLQVPPQ